MLLALVALTLSPALNAQANAGTAAWTPPGPTVCRFSGWTVNDKPAIVVRAEASATAKVVGSLPTTRGESLDPALDYYSVTFDLVEARDGWLKIKGASDEMSEKPRPVYQGEGWIEAGDMQVGVQSARGYARPDAGSERLLDLKGDWLRDRVALRGIVACDGEWLLLDYEMRNDEAGRWRRRTASGAGVVPWHLRVRGDQLRHALGRPVAGRPRAGSRRLFMPPLRRGPAA